jgi:dTMP kinase
LKGLFVTFEGPEGSGKTTQIRRLATALRERGYDILVTREPGGAGAFGTRVRDLLLAGGDMAPAAELFLFLADRAQHVQSVIRPALERGQIVLCDRYADSTNVYQGVARGFGEERAKELNQLATGGLSPDLTLILDIPPELGLGRRGVLPDLSSLMDEPEANRLDLESLEFHQKVREAFLAAAKREPRRYRVIDGSGAPEEVGEAILGAVEEFLRRSGYNKCRGSREAR